MSQECDFYIAIGGFDNLAPYHKDIWFTWKSKPIIHVYLIVDDTQKSYYEDQYESIYEVIRHPESESDFEEIPEEEVNDLKLTYWL